MSDDGLAFSGSPGTPAPPQLPSGGDFSGSDFSSADFLVPHPAPPPIPPDDGLSFSGMPGTPTP